MGRAFFNSWQTWEKMVFVLACAIVVTVFAGCLKLLWNRWRLRKYTAIAKANKSHLEYVRQTRDVIQLKGEDVPFGVRAIESGIEVDGIWISKSNTPASSMPVSPALPATGDVGESFNTGGQAFGTPPHLEISHLGSERPQSSSRKSSSSSRPPCSYDRTVSRDRLPSRSSSSGSMSGIRHLPRTSSNLKFGNYGLLADQSTLDRLEGYKSGQSQRASEESTYGRSFVSTSSRPGSAREQLLPKTGPRPSSEALPHVPGDIDLADAGRVSEGGSANLQSLYSHRISHAAETGQLLPRSRRYTHDAGPPSIPPIVVHSGSSDDFFNFGKPPLETPPLETDRASNPFSTPPGAPSPGALDFQPPPASHVSISASHPSSSAQPVETPQQNFSRSAVQTPAHALQPTDVNQQGRRTHILRKVNSNFEILVPGTLDVRDSHVDGSDDPDPDLEAGAKRHSRKLRKKKRLTLHGRSSNFTEEFDA